MLTRVESRQGDGGNRRMFAWTKSDSRTTGPPRGQRPRFPAARARLGELFPETPDPGPSSGRRRLAAVTLQAALVLAAIPVLLLRSAGRPVWDTIYAEDLAIFLPQAIRHPWHLFIPYAGYLELLPRLIAQAVAHLPLRDAAREMAMAGALAAAGSALVVYHASAGHIRSGWLRLTLAAGVVLLPVAPLEIIDSASNLCWYAMMALFFAALWRPHTRTGMTVAALVAFLTASTNTMVIVLAPLFAARLFVLRRPRDHAVTAGWLAGCVLQVPVMLDSVVSGAGSRLVGQWAPPHDSLLFFGHDVVLPAAGWRLSWWLRDRTGTGEAVLIMGIVLAVVFGTILARQPRSRAFVLTALLSGFLFSVLAATLQWRLAGLPVTPSGEPGARYSAVPIFLFESAAIAGVDRVLRAGVPARPNVRRLTRPLAVVALVAVLGSAWTADFRYRGWRGDAPLWAHQVARWHHACRDSARGVITVHPATWPAVSLPCDRLRF